MGWLFTEGQTKDELIERCLHGRAAPPHFRTVAHRLVGNNLWIVFERKLEALQEDDIDPGRFIALYMLRGGRQKGWGYKEMEESSGPSEVNCPVKFLNLVSDPGGYATDWRCRVREYHKEQNARRRGLSTRNSKTKLREVPKS